MKHLWTMGTVACRAWGSKRLGHTGLKGRLKDERKAVTEERDCSLE